MYQTIRDPVRGKMQGTIKEMSLFRLLQQGECSLKRNIKKIKVSKVGFIEAGKQEHHHVLRFVKVRAGSYLSHQGRKETSLIF